MIGLLVCLAVLVPMSTPPAMNQPTVITLAAPPATAPYRNPEWWLVWLGFPTLAFVFWQALRTHHSANAARDSAVAALRQTELSTKAGRPWLKIEASGDSTFAAFKAVNCGNSPAKIVFTDPVLRFEVVQHGDELPDQPDYGHAYGELGDLVNVHLLAPGDVFPLAEFMARQLFETFPEYDEPLKAGMARLWLYSTVKYQGTLTDDVYESRFCYFVLKDGLRFAGPPAITSTPDRRSLQVRWRK